MGTRIVSTRKATLALEHTIALKTTGSKTVRTLAVAVAIMIASVTLASAQTGSGPAGPGGVPVSGAPATSGIGATRTTETPYESPAGDGAAPATLPETGSHHRTKAYRSRHSRHVASADSSTVEPTQGHLKLAEDSYAYQRPSKSSTKIQPVQAGKFVNIIGTTSHYAQVKLKNEQIAYIPLTAIDLVKPTDKQFTLTADSAVLSAPNHSAAKIAEVHRGRDVHVVGIAMNYVKIRMKNGTEGFIPVHVLE